MSWLREPNAEPIPGYRLIEPLGNGGFGEVWKAEAPGGLFKAIKFVYGNVNSLDVDCVRAEQEKHALERIKEVRHPFVCSIERFEVVDGELVIVMELADKSLHDLFQECVNSGLIGIPRDDLLRYLRDAAEALDYMNEKHNLQHLDVKPRNLFMVYDRVKVADFGLVKHLERTSASGLLGGVTPLYAAPETFRGKISKHSDQYSLAIVYQELLTGQRPFTGKNARLLMQAHMEGEPELRPLPEAERPIVARSLAKDPEKRFPNCMAFVRALYTARSAPKRTVAAAPDLALAGKLPRSKSLSETMEDVNLGADAENFPDPDAEVDLGGPLPPGVSEEPSELGMTVPQPTTGALRPTLIIGVGGFGRKALLELRCRFLDRFGDLDKLPLLRFLCIDTDPEAVNMAVRGAPEVALARSEVHHLPLQPVGNYRRRMIEQLGEWLPREKLYALPRSLQTQGMRGLGRLAFVDNQQRLLARLKREIQEATNPDVIYQSVTQTGLALRDNTPRVYVIGAAGGGNSGLLPDLGYALRRLLQQMRHPEAEVTALLLGGAPNDPATPRTEQANVYATFTELNHFADPSVSFAAQYGVDGQRLIDQGAPFGSVYVLPLAHRSPEALDETLSHLGSYLFHELTTPLGLHLDHLRRGLGGGPDGNDALTSFRSFGTYGIWFPRGLLLRQAARRACKRLIETWLAVGDGPLPGAVTQAVTALCESVMSRADLAPEALAAQIEKLAGSSNLSDLGATPAEALTGLLAAITEQSLQSLAQEDPAGWGRQALIRARDWLGSSAENGQDGNDWRKSKLNRALAGAAQKLAEEWDRDLTKLALALMDRPGARVAAAEQALTRLQDFCQAAAQEQRARLAQQMPRTAQLWQQVEAALQECLEGGGFRWFGGRSPRRRLRHFVDCLTQYARQRYGEEMIAASRGFFAALHGRLGERLRDLGFCRQRLRYLDEGLEHGSDRDEDMAATRPGAELTVSHTPVASTEAYWEAIRQSPTARVVLPNGEEELERAAYRFLQTLTPEHWSDLDRELHERVLAPRGGLHAACVNSGDMTRTLTVPLLDEAISLLGCHLPIMDVAQILAAELGIVPDATGSLKGSLAPAELEEMTRGYLRRATPLLARAKDAGQQWFLLVPASAAGNALGEALQKVLPEIKVVRVPGQADLMFCREQGCLHPQDLQRLLRNSRGAYEGSVTSPASSSHARFDITDWVPLDP
ncbi:MAG: protein kinase [Gemmataceae bacterium]|nr:protein kinase [Gemmataceae bacterium]